MYNKLNYLKCIALSMLIFSCSSDDDQVEVPKGDYDNGFIILNEGSFGNGNASVSFLSEDSSVVTNNVFNTVTGIELGDVAESIAFYGEEAYIVVNNSQKIEVINRYTFEHVTTITEGILNPRYIVFKDEMAYVTNWGEGGSADDDFVAVINPETYTVTSTIPVTEGPEEILVSNQKLYITHYGGWNKGNTVSVIDANNNVTSIEVGVKPDDIALDREGNLWVLCEGDITYDESWNVVPLEASKFVKINTNSDTIEKTITLGDLDQTKQLAYSDGNLYYSIDGNVYVVNESDSSVNSNSVISGESIYGITAIGDRIYIAREDFSADATLDVYNSSSYAKVLSEKVGIGASKVYLNN